MMRRSMTYAAAIAVCLAAAPAVAQTAAPDQSAARLAAARTLVQALHTEQQLRAQPVTAGSNAEAAFNRFIPVQVAMRVQLNDPQGFAKARQEAIRLIAEDSQQTAAEIIPLLVEADVRRYAAHFTVEELRSLNDFYRSPIGQRLVAEQPAIAADTAQFQQNVLAPITNQHGAVLGPKLAALLTPILRQASAPTTATATAPGKKP